MRRLFALAFAVSFLLCASSALAQNVNNAVNSWLLLRNPSKSYDFQTYSRFLNAYKDWPDQGSIAMNAEHALLKSGSNAQLVEWFKHFKPATDEGRLRYVAALAAQGHNVTASETLREYWRKGSFSEIQQAAIMGRFGKWLRQSDHEKRLDTLLWQARLDRAANAMRYVSSTNIKAAANTRIAIQRGSSNAPSMFAALPANARQDNGVIFDMARYYRTRDQDERAAATMALRKHDVGEYATQWWRERNLLARRALERGNAQRAYNLAKAHGTSISGPELAEAEWLAGWIAVSRLKQPGKAFQHFERMYHNVKTPISVSRASYWAGIAAQQLGKKELAQQWYRQAAVHMNTFYGQLGAYALGNPQQLFATYFKKNQRVRPEVEARLRQDMVSATKILNGMGREKERDLFLRALLKDATAKNIPHAVIPLAQHLRSPAMALMAAKAAYEKNILIADALFPRTEVPYNATVEASLTLSIIRQESLFDRFATSPADARGLMQLLPGTARHVAGPAGVKHTNPNQLYQPVHNMTLGQVYLGRLLQKYSGFVPLAAAAYNAGPGNVDKWLVSMGDPRNDPYSWVDWVERIPFYETRNYVQRVWENYTTYKYLRSVR